ncbi:hypothetical protein Leryth_010519 [Lithospermum erythrorhizon]|nr:hypothetical protein Leryth_010519 [Lithospermum erythrorhizon]
MAEILKPNITSNSFSPLAQPQETNMETKPIKISKKTPSYYDHIHTKKTFPNWYDHKTGIYYSKHPFVKLPSDPFLDAVSYFFSHKHMGTTALIDASSGEAIEYSKLPSLVNSMASGLYQMGIRKGDVVLILLPNSILFPIVFLGVLSLGAIVAPMNPLSNPLEIKKQTIDCNIKLAFTTPEKVQKIKSLGFYAIGVPQNCMNFDNKDSIFNKIISSNPNLAPKYKINQEDTAAIMFSSGTTGGCKGVVLTHKNFIAMMALFVRFEAFQYKELPSDNVYLAILPMFHIFGLALFGIGLLSLGTTIVVMKKYDEDEMVKAIERYKVTHLTVVPPLLTPLTRKAKNGDGRLKSLKQVSCGAAPLNPRLIEEFVRTLPMLSFQGYGMTESAAVATRGYNTKEIHNYTSVGLLAPNTQAKVVDWVTGSSLPPGGVGELWLCTPGIMKGYLNNEEATEATVDENGWLHTGDIVYFDKDGYLYIVDRLKEVIKYKGFQIAPADLESVLMSHPDVVDVAVTAPARADEEAGRNTAGISCEWEHPLRIQSNQLCRCQGGSIQEGEKSSVYEINTKDSSWEDYKKRVEELVALKTIRKICYCR